MEAEITYNGGKSYKLGNVTFKEGKTVKILNPNIIQRCQATVGFSVHILEAKPVAPVIKPPVQAPTPAPPAPAPPPEKIAREVVSEFDNKKSKRSKR